MNSKSLSCLTAAWIMAFVVGVAPLFAEHEHVGPPRVLRHARKLAVLNGWHIYTVEEDGGLYRTDPNTGARKQIGRPEFGNTEHLYAIGDWVYTIEKDGSLYRVHHLDGTWSRIGEAGEWAGVVTGGVLRIEETDDAFKDALLTVERDGGMYRTDLRDGTRNRVGKPEFGNTKNLCIAESVAFTIEDDGWLYRVEPTTGEWRPVGDVARLFGIYGLTFLDGELYAISDEGLFAISTVTGQMRAIGGAEFEETAFVCAAAGQVLAIDDSGNILIVDRAAGVAPAKPQSDRFKITPVGDGRFSAVVEYVNPKGEQRIVSLEATGPEIEAWAKAIPGLPDQLRAQIRLAVGVATRAQQKARPSDP